MIGSYLKSLLEKAFYAQGTDFSKPSRLAHEYMSKCKKDATTQWMHCRESKWFYVTQSKERMYKATHDSLMDRDGWLKRNSVKEFLPLKIPPLKKFIELHCIFVLFFKSFNYLFVILKIMYVFYNNVESWKGKQVIKDDLSSHWPKEIIFNIFDIFPSSLSFMDFYIVEILLWFLLFTF